MSRHVTLTLNVFTFWIALFLASPAVADVTACLQNEDGTPLSRFFVTHNADWWAPTRTFMTDQTGCVTVTDVTTPARVTVHAHNPVVRVNDGANGFAVAQSLYIANGGTHRIRAQGAFFTLAMDLRRAYQEGLQEFTPWGGEFPAAISRTSSGWIGAVWPDGSVAVRAFVEPSPVGLAALIHLKEADNTNNGIMRHELGHALHFSAMSAATRERIQNTYIAWLIENIDNPVHSPSIRTTPFVAFIEAFGMLGEYYTETYDPILSKGSIGTTNFSFSRSLIDPIFSRHEDFYAESRARTWYDDVMGDDTEGAVFGTLFVEFASDRAVGLDYVVTSIVDCESITIQEYATCIADLEGARSSIYRALVDAGHEFDIEFEATPDAWTGAGASGDRFGETTVAGDFDGDSYPDLAVGAPDDSTAGVRGGAVYLWKGSRTGLHPWMRIDQRLFGARIEVEDSMGSAIAAGDFDGDGLDDLAIGSPGEDLSDTTLGTGFVHVLRGDPTYPRYWRGLSQSRLGANEAGDNFGAALTTADFDDDGRDDLAVGGPGEKPGNRPKSGWVFLFRGTTSGPSPWTAFGYASLAPLGEGHRFGAAMTSGDFDNDGVMDLAVAAPDWRNGEQVCSNLSFSFFGQTFTRLICTTPPRTGAVFVYRGVSGSAPSPQHFITQETLGALGEAGDRFGESLAAGDVDIEDGDELVIGAPGARQVLLSTTLAYTKGGPRAGVAHVATFASGDPRSFDALSGFDFGRTRTAGDDFGAAVAVAELQTAEIFEDVAIGAPGAAPVGGSDRSGEVFLARGSTTALRPWRMLDQTAATAVGAGDPDHAGDRFGGSLALADFDGDGQNDTAVGAAQDRFTTSGATTGAVYVFPTGSVFRRLDETL